MPLLALILSRLVPLLLLLSACLALGRFLFDRLNSRSHLVATSLFGGFIALGPLLAVPYANRLRLRIAAEQAFSDRRWEDADRDFSRYRELGGHESDAMRFHSAVSLMNLRQWSEAERVLLSSARREARGLALPPPMVIQVGICLYFEGRLGEAREVLEGWSKATEEYLRLYFLGRIAERSGADSLALAQYKRCLAQRMDFYPAVYQAVRLELAHGDRLAAERTLSGFLEGPDRPEREKLALALARAVRGLEGPLAPREFALVQH